ncbi:MAG: putative PLP-dependent enzyme involved in cell wall biosis [Bacteroidota bacterium]|nr:putative PLP-dependent enzyme involved in cell wall biosis [Bacteroidota bacterium]
MKIPFLDLTKINKQYESSFKAAYEEVVQSGHFILGNRVQAFEKDYAAFCQTKHCIGVSNGLDALKLILKGYKELGQLAVGDEIIVPSNTFIATLLSVTANKMVPILVEPDEKTYCISAALIEQSITPKTRAIVAVHLYGQIAEMNAIYTVAQKHGLLVIEDAAQSHGAIYHGKRSGGLGDAAAHSFYPAKNLGALGDAGAVTTNNNKLTEVITALRNYGSQKKYEHLYSGENNRMDELQAAMLSIKLKHLEQDNELRRTVANKYLSGIKNSAVKLPVANDQNEHVWHLFVVRIKERERFKQYLLQQGIETLIHYPIAPHKQVAYKELNHLSLPITEALHREVISLPISPVMTMEEVEYVIKAVNAFT